MASKKLYSATKQPAALRAEEETTYDCLSAAFRNATTKSTSKPKYVNHRRAIASLDSQSAVKNNRVSSAAIFRNDMHGGSKTVANHEQEMKKSQSKAYDLIRQAIGYNKDGPTYQNFSNIFSMHSKGTSNEGLEQTVK